MEREIIERLAIDQALGELDADTAALFEAYLVEHDEAQDWAHAMARTCARTREALSQKAQPVDMDHHTPDGRGPWQGTIAWRTWGRWAAVVLMALGLGAAAGRWSGPQVATPRTVVVQAESPSARHGWRQVLSKPGQGFWETKAMAMLQTKPEGTPRAHTSPRSLWDRYRQSIKERDYE